MAETIILTSMDNPRIKALVNLREHKQRVRSGLFIAEGPRLVRRAFEAGLRCLELYICPDLPDGGSWDQTTADLKLDPSLRRRLEQETRLYQITPSLLAKAAYCENPQGPLGVFEQPQWRLEEAPWSRVGAGGEKELWLVMVGTQKPGNLGAMARTAEAAGVTGVIVADAVVDAFNPNSLRASTGAVLRLPVVAVDAPEARAFLVTRGVQALATTPAARVAYSDVDLTNAVAILIGPEDTGLDETWLAAAQPMAVPMPGHGVDSLNASVTAGVVLFEALRQRRAAMKGQRPG